MAFRSPTFHQPAVIPARWVPAPLGPSQGRAGDVRFLAGCLLANLVLCSITTEMVFFVSTDVAATSTDGLNPTLPDKIFLVTQCLIAFVVSGGLATGHSLMAKISSPAMLNELFGLFAMSGTATSSGPRRSGC